MRHALRVLPALLFLTLAAPVEAAACTPPSEPVLVATPEGMYVRMGQRVEVWQESNGVPGLQTAAFLCGTRAFAPDARVLA